MLAVTVASFAVSYARRTLPSKRPWWVPLALIPLAVLFLQFPISDPVWNALPKLRFLQFPWRWLVVLESPMAVFLGSALISLRFRSRCLIWIGSSAVFALALAATAHSFFLKCESSQSLAAMLAANTNDEGYSGTAEYSPLAANTSDVASNLPESCLAEDPNEKLGQSDRGMRPAWTSTQNTCKKVFPASSVQQESGSEHFQYSGIADHPGYLILRLRAYPAWRIVLNGSNVTGSSQSYARSDGLIVVPVPQGPVRISVDWVPTADAIAGRWITWIALLLLPVVWLAERRSASLRLSSLECPSN
jgi:hypothetical protein